MSVLATASKRKTFPHSNTLGPTSFAEYLGKEYSGKKSAFERKENGIFFTPEPVARFMADLFVINKSKIRLLDPAAGVGILICAAVEKIVKSGEVKEVEIVAFEIDQFLAGGLRIILNELQSWAAKKHVAVSFEINVSDFILSECDSLEKIERCEARRKFDFVIGNPPYFKISKNDPRALATSEIVYGQPNIYSTFMAASAALLKTNGQFVYITPRSFASGPYFSRFRRWFFDRITPTQVHIFNSRRDAFGRDDVLQENVIFAGIRKGNENPGILKSDMLISTSHGMADLDDPKVVSKPISVMISGDEMILRIPATEVESDALTKVETWQGCLASYGLKISTGPVVAFRATGWLRMDGKDAVPLLWLNHIFPLNLHWPNGIKKPQYIDESANRDKLLLPNRNYVVMRRFSAKEDSRRLMVAPLLKNTIESGFIGLENHLNYIYRPNGNLTTDETWGLAALFSSNLLDAYFRCVNGSTQVSATELRTMPLPPLEKIVQIGRRIKHQQSPMEFVDKIIKEILL